MGFSQRIAALLLVLMFTGNMVVNAQSVRGKIIYVSPLQEIKLKFRSAVANYSFVNKNQSSAFRIKQSGHSLRISNVTDNFKPANLVITEGRNTHLFILAYKASLDASTETVYDFSSKEKLQEYVQRGNVQKPQPMQQVQVKDPPVPQTNNLVTQAVTIPQPKAETNVEPFQPISSGPSTSSSPAAEAVNNKSISTVSTAPAKANTSQQVSSTVSTPTYSTEIAKATAAYRAKDYVKARSYFQSALKLNPSAKYPGVRISELNVLIARKKKNRKMK